MQVQNTTSYSPNFKSFYSTGKSRPIVEGAIDMLGIKLFREGAPYNNLLENLANKGLHIVASAKDNGQATLKLIKESNWQSHFVVKKGKKEVSASVDLLTKGKEAKKNFASKIESFLKETAEVLKNPENTNISKQNKLIDKLESDFGHTESNKKLGNEILKKLKKYEFDLETVIKT